MNQLQENGVKVYLAFSCLLGDSGGMHEPMRDADQNPSENWISPADEHRVTQLSDEINWFCDQLDPHGVLLWYATYPNAKYGYECDRCVVAETNHLDIDEQATVLTGFIRQVTDAIRKNHPDVRIAIQAEVNGERNITYRNGLDIETLGGVIDDLFLHIRNGKPDTINRAIQLTARAEKDDVSCKYYFSVVMPENLEKLYDSLNTDLQRDVLIYSRKKDVVEDCINSFLLQKWETTVERALLTGSTIAFILGMYEFYAGIRWPVIGDIAPTPSLLLAATLLILSLKVDELPSITERLASIFRNRTPTSVMG